MSDNFDFLIKQLPRDIEALEEQKMQLLAQANYVAGQIDAKKQVLAALTAPPEPEADDDAEEGPAPTEAEASEPVSVVEETAASQHRDTVPTAANPPQETKREKRERERKERLAGKAKQNGHAPHQPARAAL